MSIPKNILLLSAPLIYNQGMATKKTTKKGASKAQKRKQLQKKQIVVIAVIVIVVLVALFLLAHFNVIDVYELFGLKNPSGDNGNTNNNGTKPSGTPAAGKLEDIDMNACIKVHFIDVGQGDSILIELDKDTTMLIDAGHTSTNGNNFNKDDYFTYIDGILENSGGNDIDYLIATHPDADHISLLPTVFERYQVNNTYMNAWYPSKTAEKVHTAAENELNSTLKEFDTADDTVIPLPVSNYSLTIYSSGNDGFSGSGTKNNSMSIICMLEYGGKKILFTGDAVKETEEWFIAKTENDTTFDIDVLKVAHHGSKGSSCEQFLDYVKAEYAVISSGAGNTYNHPNQETLDRLNNRHTTIYDTQDYGTITLYIDNEGDMCFVTEKTPEAAE